MTLLNYSQTKQSGFSLIEVLIAISVLAVGLIAMARFQATVLHGSSLARERSEAVALAEQKIEQLRNYRDAINTTAAPDYSEIAALCATGTGTVENNNVYSNSGKSGNTVYTRTCTSAAPVSSGNYSYTQVTVRVTWARPGATADTDAQITLISIITNANPRFSGKLT